MSKSINIHATCVRLGRKGILLLGRSGAGKSDLALRLIARGAVLVADDRCDVSVERSRLVARAPKAIAGLIEVRGVGIVRMAHAPSATIALVADLDRSPQRMPVFPRYAPPPPLRLRQSAQPRMLALNAFEASAPDKIAVALGYLPQGSGRVEVKGI